jgi:hypothetical protein
MPLLATLAAIAFLFVIGLAFAHPLFGLIVLIVVLVCVLALSVALWWAGQ